VRSAEEPDIATGRVVRPDVGGVVSRPALSERLGTSARVTVVSAPAGSGKTVLLRSWMSDPALAGRTAWVPAGRDERDPQRFWLSVLGALRGTVPGLALVQALTPAPDLDGWAIVERLLTDLAPLRDRVWLVIDDAHELGSAEARRQLELLVMRAPPGLRFVLATRQDLQVGLHRLRLEGELTEIRPADLRFSLSEARELLATAGVMLPEPSLVMLHERTEGWVAGLRLAALSLAGHPEPERFAAEFSGSERTVAEYLLAEVLDRQSEQVRRLLLRTSVLDMVNGELAGLLTGDPGGERVLQDLEQANAFVVSLDAARSWFRYHQLFADLLQLELRRTAPDEVTALHRAAAGWLAGQGYPEEAIRHAQAARDWGLAARLLAGRWSALYLDGKSAVIHELLTGFPAGTLSADSELAVVVAADELTGGSIDQAERYLRLAERGSASVPDGQREQARLLLRVVRLLLARQCGNLPAVVEEARRLQEMTEATYPAQPGLTEDLHALALISLGSTEVWAARIEDAARHLERGVALARQIGRPFLEFTGLAHLATVEVYRSFARATQLGTEAVELARRHGWTDEPAAGTACIVLGSVLVWQGRLEEAEPWVQRAERTRRAEAEPTTGQAIRYIRGMLELGRGRDTDALAAFVAGERADRLLAEPNLNVTAMRAFTLQALVRLGETERAGQELAELGDQDRERGEIRIAEAVLRLTEDDPQAAAATLAPVIDGSVPMIWPMLMAQVFLLVALACDALGDRSGTEDALERALDLAEPEGALLWFLVHPAPGLLERHARHRTTHGALIADILSLLAGSKLVPPPAGSQPPAEALSKSEIRVLRYLPTNLTAPDIASELHVSRNTVKTHMRNLYAKLGTHRRAEAVDRARNLGLLAPSARHR
jgi:LuxR family maltose regulon positive regulatory protein